MKIIRHSLPNPEKIARHFSKIAIQALYDEVALYPKPGLVSFVDSGAHQDMDGALFYRSLFTLRHYFFRLGLNAALGYEPQDLVHLGIAAEAIMHACTKGVNTHRGAIFALGIVCASICRLSAHNQQFSTDELHHFIRECWANYLLYEHPSLPSHGLWVEQQYKVAGAKQLAIEGYQRVFDVFHQLSELDINNKTILGLKAYHLLLNQLDDNNVLYRTGPKGLLFAREQINKAFACSNEEELLAGLLTVHQSFIERNISPGGVADMLGIIFFLHRL